jgi:hypothetical protein
MNLRRLNPDIVWESSLSVMTATAAEKSSARLRLIALTKPLGSCSGFKSAELKRYALEDAGLRWIMICPRLLP